MSLTKLAATAAEIRTKKGFRTPDRLRTVAEGEVECALAGMAHYFRALGEVMEHVRSGEVALAALSGAIDDKLTYADLELCAIDHDVLAGAEPSISRPDAMLAKVALIGSEVGEAVTAVLGNDPENFAEELADIVIRVLDIAGTMGINLDFEVARKMNINAGRPERHGKLA